MLPDKDRLTICFAHAAYRMAERFALRNTGLAHVEVRSAEELARALPGANVLVVSMLWKNELAPIAGKLKFIQSISAGTDQYDRDVLRAHGIRLASGQGVNANAVAEHAVALMLALSRQLHFLRDHQQARHWRPMQGDRRVREDEIEGKTVLIVGMGGIGQRLAATVDAFPGRVFQAEVLQIARKAEFTPRNIQTDAERIRQVFAVKLRLPDDPDLRPGMTAEVKLDLPD